MARRSDSVVAPIHSIVSRSHSKVLESDSIIAGIDSDAKQLRVPSPRDDSNALERVSIVA
jgi:hypothetical protein